MTGPDIRAFLEARLAEDQALIERNTDGRGLDDGFPDYRTYDDTDTRAADDYINRFGPARALAEVAAKRRVLERHHPAAQPNYRFGGTGPIIYTCEGCGYDTNWCGEHEPRTGDINDCPELRDIAAIYADHEDYAPKWSETP